MATETDLTIRQGGSYELEVKLFEEDGTTPLNPTGMGVHYRVASNANSAAALELNTADLTIAQVSTDWVVTVPLTSARTKGLARALYYHELYLDDGGERSVMMFGAFIVKAAQTALHGA